MALVFRQLLVYANFVLVQSTYSGVKFGVRRYGTRKRTAYAVPGRSETPRLLLYFNVPEGPALRRSIAEFGIEFTCGQLCIYTYVCTRESS